MINRIIKKFINKPQILSSDELKLKNLEKDLKMAREAIKKAQKRDMEDHLSYLKGRAEAARQEYIHKAFEIKLARGESFKLPPEAQKVFREAVKISEAGMEQAILAHGRDYAFLVDSRHFLYKHIRTLHEKWGANDSLVKSNDFGQLILRTHGDSGNNNHVIEKLRNQALSDQNLTYDLDYFSLSKRYPGHAPTHLKRNFKAEAGKGYRVSVVTDCPTKNLSMTGNHAWLRLYDNNGDVYSIGLFPETLNMPYLFEKSPVQFSHSDKHEWLLKDDSIREHVFDLQTKERFEILKANIERDLQGAKNRDFTVFGKNCADWDIEKLSQFFDFDVKEAQTDIFDIALKTDRRVYKKYVPGFMRKVIDPLRHLASKVFLQVPRFALIRSFGGTKKPEHSESESYLKEAEWFGSVTNITHPYKFRLWLDEHHAGMKLKPGLRPNQV